MKPRLVKSAEGEALLRGTMAPLGKCHSPTFPLSIVLQHLVLTLLVTHTRDEPGSVDEVISPISVMSIESPGRYTMPFSVKYRPKVGTAHGNNIGMSLTATSPCKILSVQ